MKRSPPYLLPKNFPRHAPLPPGGPWIRPATEEDWEEATLPFLPPPESGPRATTGAPLRAGVPAWPESYAASEPRDCLGRYLVPSLTPLPMVEAARTKRTA